MVQWELVLDPLRGEAVSVFVLFPLVVKTYKQNLLLQQCVAVKMLVYFAIGSLLPVNAPLAIGLGLQTSILERWQQVEVY